MKETLGTVLLAALLAFSCSSEKASQGFSGHYVGTQNFGIGQVSSAMSLTLRQSGNTFTGMVTPPFQSTEVSIINGRAEGNGIRFEAAYGNLTYHYEGVVQGSSVQGNFQPLGCVMQSSGQPCVTDSNGTFNLTKQ